MSYSGRIFTTRRKSILTPAGGVICIASVFAIALMISVIGQAESNQFDPSVAVMMPAKNIDWINEAGGVSAGQGYGDRETGEYGSFVSFPSEFVTPDHSHTNAYHGVVITGTMINPMAADGDELPIQLGPGSYWFVPAGKTHITACISDSPCTFYTHSTVFFDFIG